MLNKLRQLFKPIDMTIGDPAKNILLFAIPMLIGNIAQQLYNTVDSIIVGRYVGDNALAAVGSAGPIFNLLLVFFVGISAGAGIMVSQYFGAKKRKELSKSICITLTMTAASVLFVMIITPFVARPLLELLNTPASIIDWCENYLLILFIGSAGLCFYNILGGILRGLGDSFSALIYLLVATVINIVLDYLFVAKFGLEVPGVALATVIAQITSAVLSFMKLRKMTDLFDLKKEYFKPQKKYLAQLLKLGLPSGITQAIFSLSGIVVQSLTNSFGEQFIAANVIIMRVDGFVMMPAFSFGVAMTTFAGQNVGAGLMDRVRDGTKRGTTIAVCISAVLTALILVFGKYIMGIFTSTPELVALASSLMRIIAPGYIMMEITQCLSGVMRGAGDTVTPMWISIVTTVAIRVPLAYLLVALTKSSALPTGDCSMMMWSMLIAWLIGAALTFIMYMTGNWKKKAITANK